MKTFTQKKKRSRARKRDREKGIWVYMSMTHVCPNSKRPHKRRYYIYDDVSGMYISDKWNQGYSKDIVINGLARQVIKNIKGAGKFENFIADRYIASLKGLGKWRAIRVK